MPQARRKCVYTRVHVCVEGEKEREADIGRRSVNRDNMGRVGGRKDFSFVHGVL